MKIYEKPMAIIEKIDVKDVITASGVTTSNYTILSGNDAKILSGDSTGKTKAVIFNW